MSIQQIERVTQFSECRRYRYTLWREWDTLDMFEGCNDGERGEAIRHEYLMVIGLNPSTADETKDDPTIRKCIGFAKRWGFGALCMTNLFAWRDTKPENMKKSPEPIGMDNRYWVAKCAAGAAMVLAAWGKNGSHLGQENKVAMWIRDVGVKMFCLCKNNDGSPMHPLYVPYETKPIDY